MRSTNTRPRVILAVLLVAGLGLSTAGYADDDDLRGVITARGTDGTVTVRADDSSTVVVVLNDETKITRHDGLRSMTLSSAALIPGLRVEVEGVYLTANRYAAERVSFSRADMKMVFAIQGRIANEEKILRASAALDATNKRITAQGQSENRRAVVTSLRNTGISDTNPANRVGTTVERVNPTRR